MICILIIIKRDIRLVLVKGGVESWVSSSVFLLANLSLMNWQLPVLLFFFFIIIIIKQYSGSWFYGTVFCVFSERFNLCEVYLVFS